MPSSQAYKKAIAEITKLQCGFAEDSWVVLENNEWRPLTTEEIALVEQKATELDFEQKRSEMTQAIQTLLDTKAQEFQWDDMKSARAGYVPVKDTDSIAVIAMKNQAEKLTDWYYAVWGKSAEILAEVEAGTIIMPTVVEVLAQLPEFIA